MGMEPEKKSGLARYSQNMAIASTLSQVGCVTVVIVVGALLLGLWLDNVFDTRPVLTIVFILVSIPVSLFSLVKIALSAASQIQQPTEQGNNNE
jgi:F0F1-type ATP synthase assembly protein I